MIRSILTGLVVFVIMFGGAWGWGTYQHYKGKHELVCVKGKVPVKKNGPDDPFAGIPWPLNGLIRGIGESFF